MEPITAESIRTLLGVADLSVPHERHELLAKRLGPMMALANRLSVKMRETPDTQPITQVSESPSRRPSE
jgi:hypothetical protein